jgi:hypothetical protein
MGERKVTARGKKRDKRVHVFDFIIFLVFSRSLSLVHRLTNRSTRLDLLRHAIDGAARAKRRNTNIAHARTFDAIAFTNDVVQHRWRAAAQVEEAIRRVVVRARGCGTASGAKPRIQARTTISN